MSDQLLGYILNSISLNFVSKFSDFLFTLSFLFVIFEIIPILFLKQNTIYLNIKEFFQHQFLRGFFCTIIFLVYFYIFHIFQLPMHKFDITHLPLLVQYIITYLLIDLVLYSSHFFSHHHKIIFISKAHKFHHTVTSNLQWVNARKESYGLLALYVFVFFFFYHILFNSAGYSHIMVTATYITLLSFSHFRIPFTIPYLDKVFLFPKDHLRHHTDRSGPYGTSLSLFDTIFGTRHK